MGKYDPLGGYLRRLKTDSVDLGFAEIERILGAMLPKSAQRPQWWANQIDPQGRHVQTRAWREAGYDAFPEAGAERVRFVRRQV
ncbi:hypothetical protein CFHF_07760 [Caulobacter flavus]|jgi:hypothetical protein|uniref:DUF7662 domain-containing protein n=1 Tax=Caulobacter flavus TaxID=1679497 RepID=A0A2N5CVZ4_9CAUL|nr:hypothetical protein [Caulobacter flavus]AYV48232.1 hypothetical protein C1707_19290 [Caulobacter flavus]PLR17984.1 hypothetical protein CFHF_07760 [Caulobacter flavus]